MRLLPPHVTPDTPMISQPSVGIVVNGPHGECGEAADENQAAGGGNEQGVAGVGEQLSE